MCMNAAVDTIQVRTMKRDDLPACLTLKRLAGWNQLPEDWEIFLSLRPHGCFVAVADDRVVGTVTTIDYEGRFSWIGMVLVHPDFRRRGIGTALMQAAVDSLKDCETIKLDATAAGKQVYDRLGFVDEYRLARFVREGQTPRTIPAMGRPDPCAMTTDHLRDVAKLDAAAFGVDRSRVLELWLRRTPRYAFVLLREGRPVAYCMGRPGANFETIGPLVATEEAHAEALVLAAVREMFVKPICIDLFDCHPRFASLLECFGFSLQREFVRMYRGPNRYPGNTALQWAVCGPEIG